MGLRGRLKKAEKAAKGETVEVRRKDGTNRKFYGAYWKECFLHEHDRGDRAYRGEEPAKLPAHPFVEALRNAAEGEVERLASEQGTWILHFLGEDEIIRGERERPGPPVRETSPGRYE